MTGSFSSGTPLFRVDLVGTLSFQRSIAALSRSFKAHGALSVLEPDDVAELFCMRLSLPTRGFRGSVGMLLMCSDCKLDY